MAYTTINDPTQYFDIVTYTGDGSSSQTITGLGFQADFLWIKNRTEARNNFLANTKFNPPIIGSYAAVGGSTGTAINLSVTSDTLNYVVFNEALKAGYDGQGLVTINLTVSNNAKLGSIVPGLPGLDFRGFPTNCVLNLTISSGSAIYGCGGTGGRGGGWGQTAPSGGAGGDAIWLDKATTITNNGTVAGGGGGGGGGAGWAPTGAYGMGGAGGGGGAGFNGGSGGSAEGSSVDVSAATNGSDGTTTSGGSGGSGSSKDGYTTHSGATGGGLGAAGGGSTGSHTSWAGQVSNGGSGGAGGKYIDGNTYATWSTEGTRTGSANTSVTNGGSLNAYLISESTSQLSTGTDVLNEINSTGFKVGANNKTNENTKSYVAWAWKSNNGSATFNDASSTGVGTIDSTYEVNTTAGFSIVQFTKTGDDQTVGHGLGKKPKLIITKPTNTSGNWVVLPEIDGVMSNKYLVLNATDALGTDGSYAEPTSSVFSVSNQIAGNNTFIAYCFAEIKGYSKFGKYTGNGSADGTFVYTGFKPAFVLTKRTDSAGQWYLKDTKRSSSGGFNTVGTYLKPNSSDAEGTNDSAEATDILSNGFKQRNTEGNMNASGGTYIYMAFAESPFVSSDGVPTTAR